MFGSYLGMVSWVNIVLYMRGGSFFVCSGCIFYGMERFIISVESKLVR